MVALLLKDGSTWFLALVVTVSCGNGSTATDAGGDADVGPDADAGREAGRSDAGRDAARLDAGADSGRDASLPPDPEAGWVALPGIPAGCVIERAEHPEALFMPTWVDCPGIEGCQQLAIDERYQRAIDWSSSGAHDGARGYFFLVQGRRRIPERMVVLARTDGPPLGAWREQAFDGVHLCIVGPTAVDSTHATYDVSIGADDGSLPYEEMIFHAAHSSIGSVEMPVATLRDPIVRRGAFYQSPVVSSSAVAAELQPAGRIVVIDEGRVRTLGGSGTAVTGIPQRPQVVGSHVLWQSWSTFVSIAHGSISDDAAPFLATDDVDYLGFRTDGVDMAWAQCFGPRDDGTCERSEVWTAPYVRRPGDVRPRFVAALPHHVTVGSLSGGWFSHLDALPDGRRTIELIRLADGEHRRFIAPDGYDGVGGIQTPLWTTPDELAVPGYREGVGGTVFRVAIAALERVDGTTAPTIRSATPPRRR